MGNEKDGVFQTIVMKIEKIKIKKGIFRIYMIQMCQKYYRILKSLNLKPLKCVPLFSEVIPSVLYMGLMENSIITLQMFLKY